jgi:predicted GNAT family acetyltransferase
MEVLRSEEGSKGRFAAMDNGTEAGYITYSKAGDTMLILDHTEVNDAYRGQGIGKIIVMHIVDVARRDGLKVLPLCPFAKSVFDRTEEIRDVLR